MTRFLILALTLLFPHIQFAQLGNRLLEKFKEPVEHDYKVDALNKKRKDPPSMEVDFHLAFLHATWTQFDAYKSKNKNHVSVIYYSRSPDFGETWLPPKQLSSIMGNCLDGDSTLKGSNLCLGPEGELYVTWASPAGLVFQCSLDSGKTWWKEEKVINPIKNGWSCTVNNIRTDGLPQIACNTEDNAFKGRIYISWSDEKNGVNNKDVFLVYSDDKGQSWTEPILVSYRPNHKEQFKPCMKIDAKTGALYLLYFDKQNDMEGKLCDLTLAVSKNGGLKFDYYKVNEKPFQFNRNYVSLLDSTGKLGPVWMQPGDGNRFVYYTASLSDSSLAACERRQYQEEMRMPRSIPFSDKIELKFALLKNAIVSAEITKPLDPAFKSVKVAVNQRCLAGSNSLIVDTKKLGIKKGNYVLILYYNSRNSFVWVTE